MVLWNLQTLSRIQMHLFIIYHYNICRFATQNSTLHRHFNMENVCLYSANWNEGGYKQRKSESDLILKVKDFSYLPFFVITIVRRNEILCEFQ